METLMKLIQIFSQDIQQPDRDSNREPPKYKSRALPVLSVFLLITSWRSIGGVQVHLRVLLT